MSKYELTVDMNYVADWGLTQAIRELFQNAFDAQKENSENIAFCNYYPERETIEIGNKSSILNIETLLLGATSKADDSNTIGQFGEGYKLATLVLLRLGKEVTFYNYGCREVWHTKLVKSRRYNGHFVPVFDVDKKFIWQSVPHNNLIIEVKGISPEEYETIKKFVLPLNEDMGDTLDCMHLGKILLNEKYKGDVYCSGLYICHNEELQYGYDIEPRFLELERDRQTVTSFNLTWITSRMWSLHSDTTQFRELLFGNNTFDLSYIHTNLTANDELMEALRNNYGNVIPVLTQEEYNIKQKLEYIIENNIYNICFGTKKLFDKQHRLEENNYKTHTKWYNDFVKNRDKNIYFLGSANETMGNQMIYLLYDNYSESFYIKVRKIAKTDEKRCSPDNYVSYKGLTFKYRENNVIELLINQIHNMESAKPLNYRFHREGTMWYLQIIFTADFSNNRYSTRSSYGVIGLDYNDRFIQLAETNDTGNLIKLQTVNLIYHGTGNKAETEIKQKIAEIVKYAASVGKDIAIENLDFKKTKAEQFKATSNRGKEYNNMLHLFDYSRYKQTLADITFNNQVFLDLVNPKDTTKIAKQKYCKQMKLTSHQGAAFVIARRCQGYVDKLKLKTHKTTKKKVA